MSLNCSARSCVGWQRSKPSPPVACSLLICSSFCENGVELTLMPVAFSKSGITGSGSSSSQLIMLSSPEDDSALETIAGEATAPRPSAADVFRNERRSRPAEKQTMGRLIHAERPPNATERRARRRRRRRAFAQTALPLAAANGPEVGIGSTLHNGDWAATRTNFRPCRSIILWNSRLIELSPPLTCRRGGPSGSGPRDRGTRVTSNKFFNDKVSYDNELRSRVSRRASPRSRPSCARRTSSTSTGLDIGIAGVPFDGGATNRVGARHGPRAVRDLSSLMRATHHVFRINPFDLCRIADVGDVALQFAVRQRDRRGRHRRLLRALRRRGRDAAVDRRRSFDHLCDPEGHRQERPGRARPYRRAHRHARADPGRALPSRLAVPQRDRGRPARSEADGADRHPRRA